MRAGLLTRDRILQKAYSCGRLRAFFSSNLATTSLVSIGMLVAGTTAAAGAQEAIYGPPAFVDDADGASRSIEPPPAIPPALARSARDAVFTNPAIRAAEATIRATDADVKAAKWTRFPSLSIGARFEGEDPGSISPQVRLEQPLWAGGRITSTISRAEAARAVADAQLAEIAEELAGQTLDAYYGVVRAARNEEILKKSLAEHQRLVESMQRRVDQEVSPRSDLELASSRAAQVEQQLSLTTAQRYINLQRLAELTGNQHIEFGSLPEYSAAVHHPSTGAAVPQAIACSPTRRRLFAEAAIAEADRKIAEASIYPRVGAEVSHDEIYGTRFGVVVSAQTNGGLSPLAAAAGARYREDASNLQLSVAERQLREEIVLNVVENTTSAGTIRSSEAAALASASVTESFMRQFITGRRTWLDVMNAVREGMSAEMALVDAQTTAMASAGRLLLRTCEWRPDLMGPPSE